MARAPWPMAGRQVSGGRYSEIRCCQPMRIKARGGEDYGVVVAVVEFADAGVDVAADMGDLEVGAGGLDLDGAPGASGADAGPGGKALQSGAVGGQDHVPGVEAFQDGGEGEVLIHVGWHVLEAVGCGIDLSGAELVFKGGYKDASGIEPGYGGDFVVVSDGVDWDYFDLEVRVRVNYGVGGFSGLGDGEVAGPRPEL